MDNTKQTLYELLGIPQNATLKEIKMAYRKKAMEYHPDENPDKNNEFCHKMMCLINEAYRVLRNPELREIYDQKLYERNEYNVPNEDSENQSNDEDEDFYESKTKTYKKEDGNNSKREQEAYKRKYKPNQERYTYYNEVDFDGYMQEEFIEWLESFSNLYQSYVSKYYNYNDAIIDEIIESFENNINYEKEIPRKKAKSLRL